MRRLRRAAVALVTVLSASGACAQRAARVSGAGAVLSITDQHVRHRIQLPASVKVDMDTVEVIDSQNIGALTYLLLIVSGPSKRNGLGAGQCGAGVETGIVWLRLFNWRIEQSQSQLVASCWTDSEILEPLQITDEAISLKYMVMRPEQTTLRLRYDRTKPERGFEIGPAASAK